MDNNTVESLLEKAKIFFRKYIAENHLSNLKKAADLSKLNINPFTYRYLANFLTGNESPESIAKALLYPRVLGTSFTTSFGTNIQNKFCAEVLDGYGSAIDGIDIEFVDQIDKRKKYCQLKAGPDTINKGDVDPIKQHFKNLQNRARTNNLQILPGDMVIGITYGKIGQLNAHYKKVAVDYNIYIGQDFWYRLTGFQEFYYDLIAAFGEIACETNGTSALDEAVNKLASEIGQNLNDSYWK